jgi:hypothetical protein
MFNKKKKQAILNSDEVVFTKDIKTHDMFGNTTIIPKGTMGVISDINVTKTIYNEKYFENVEVTYGNKERILLARYWNKLIPLSM